MRLVNSDSWFAGYVVVHGQKIYVDTNTGSGFTKIFDLMGNFIDGLAHRYANTLDTFEDARQEICLGIFEGILKYDPTRGASLSTFLKVFVSNRMVDKVRKIKQYNEGQFEPFSIDIEKDLARKIELQQRTQHWDDKWKRIILRLFVLGDRISVVAVDENIPTWTLARAVRRKLNEARKI